MNFEKQKRKRKKGGKNDIECREFIPIRLVLVKVFAVGIPELARANCGVPTDIELF